MSELYEKTYQEKNHFSFGENWQYFLQKLTPERIEEAKRSLQDFLGPAETLHGKTFVDMGCGSGLFSLAAYRLGAKRVMSVDIDGASVQCARYLHEKEGAPPNWEIRTGSALDSSFLKTLGTFDMTYSWGVLHHTGDMWKSLGYMDMLMKPGGLLYIAIYNRNQRVLEGTSSFWVWEKRLYNRIPRFLKRMLDFCYSGYLLLGLLVHGIHPMRYVRNYVSLRGMSFQTDVRDWLGGYPYQYASVAEIEDFYRKKGFVLVRTRPARSIGCNEFLFVKKHDAA